MESLGPDDDIVEALDLDSMDVLNVMAAVAEQTGLEVPERHYPRTRTLAGFVNELMELGTPADGPSSLVETPPWHDERGRQMHSNEKRCSDEELRLVTRSE